MNLNLKDIEIKNNSNYLLNITDKNKYSLEEIKNNLKNCFLNKKCCIFSCGANLNEYKNNIKKLKENNFLIFCIKGAVKEINYDCDILWLEGNKNGNYLNNNLINNIFKISSLGSESNINNINYKDIVDYDIKSDYFDFLNYIGISEIYLFGFFLSDYILKDITNYDYYTDLIAKSSHFYTINTYSKVKECGLLKDYFRLLNYGKKYNIYNVSNEGCVPKVIKRISFDDVFNEKKNIIEYKYEDYIDLIERQFDFEFYYNKYCNNDNTKILNLDEKKNICLNNFHSTGIYLLNNVNKNDKKKSIVINNFMETILVLFCYIRKYHFGIFYNYLNNIKNIAPFFNHYVLDFNKHFKVCFYKDYELISKKEFYDNLKEKHKEKLKLIDLNNLEKIYQNTKLNNNDYFTIMYFILKKYDTLPDNFNPIKYKEINRDLKDLNNIEATEHYIITGILEKRIYC